MNRLTAAVSTTNRHCSKKNGRGIRGVIARIGLSLLGGLIIGFAWQELIPAPVGILGLGLFFFIQSQMNSMAAAIVSSVLTGLSGCLVACWWLVSTVELLAETGAILSVLLAAGVCLVHSFAFVVFAIVFRLAGKICPLPDSRLDRYQRHGPNRTEYRRLNKRTMRLNRSVRLRLDNSDAQSPPLLGSRMFRFLKSLDFHPSHTWQVLIAPIVWLNAEVLIPTLFPLSMGCLLADNPPLCQLAEIGGIHLVTIYAATIAILVPFGLNVFLVFLSWERSGLSLRIVTFLVTLCLVLWVCGWGQNRIREIENELRQTAQIGLKVLVVQSGTQTTNSNGRMIKASRSIRNKADLILWPESALGNYNRQLTDFRNAKRVDENSSGSNMNFRPFPMPNAPLLAGADTWSSASLPGNSSVNFVSALLFDEREQLVGRHDKIELMPYGEYIPGERLIPQLRNWFGNPRIISRGSHISPIGEVKGRSLGVLLCCEDMYPALFRSLAKQQAHVLITLGNGMAFNSKLPLRQHFRISRFRAIENRKYFARCMSRGVSVLVSPTGEIIHELPCMDDGAMFFELPSSELNLSFFTKHGYVPLYFGLFGTVTMWFLIAILMISRDANHSSKPPP